MSSARQTVVLLPSLMPLGNLPSRMPTHASELYSRNLYNFLSPFIKDGTLNFDWDDEVLAGTVLCREGITTHASVKQALGD